jgi:hypothetical protein
MLTIFLAILSTARAYAEMTRPDPTNRTGQRKTGTYPGKVALIG